MARTTISEKEGILMPTIIERRDRRGYLPIHLAFETRSWIEIKRIVDEGATLTVLTPSGASLEEFAAGLQLSHLFRQLKSYVSSRQ